mmetsp:Transcript_23808/g.39911  ORF Transcript_23808/g.39911 Transcript_23808/m.39911 type:complete len:762 (-) Transcript_23808:152-2437(-)
MLSIARSPRFVLRQKRLCEHVVAIRAETLCVAKCSSKVATKRTSSYAGRWALLGRSPLRSIVRSPKTYRVGALTVSSMDYSEDYEPVLQFWFHGDVRENFKRKWFPTAGANDNTQVDIDREITEKFGKLLSRAERGELEMWGDANPRAATALVVLLDQFSRHVYRTQAGREQIESNDKLALRHTYEVLKRGWETELPLSYQVFLLMPLRHTPTIERLKDVMERISHMADVHEQHDGLLQKFRKATLRRLQDLEGKQWTEGQDILEFYPFEADETDMHKHPLYKTVDKFLHEYKAREHPAIAISLSGGVDSMVLAKLLPKLREKHGSFRVVAVHIDYANRPESADEARFVEAWCLERGIEFTQLRIDAIKRGITGREEYEVESRKIRYDLYRTTMERTGAPAMLVGHHRGDVQENIISNMFKGKSLLQINGMAPSSKVNGVEVWRPMLTHDKDVVFDFAHKYGVPYFKDTTPAWATRGKLRNQLMPLLEEIYGDGYLSNLSGLGEDADQLSNMVNTNFFQTFWDSVQVSDVAVWVECEPYIHQPIFFWKETLRHVCHSMGTGMFRDKPISEFLERMKRSPIADSWITLKKGNRTLIWGGSTLVIFRSDFYPRTPYFTMGDVIELGATRTFGPWTVTTSPMAAASSSPEEGKPQQERKQEEGSQEQRVTLADVLKGEFSYEFSMADDDTLVIDPRVRALAVRGLDADVRAQLPLVVTLREAGEKRKPQKQASDDPAQGRLCVRVHCRFHTGMATQQAAIHNST